MMTTAAGGTGPLFSDPSPDVARETFIAKRRGLVDKTTTVAEAVREFIRDGDYLAVGGFGADRIPTAVLHEIVRQGRTNLGFSGHTATHDFQILCAGHRPGCPPLLARVDAAYIVGLEARGLSPQARRVMEGGTIEICEWSNYALALRYRAAASGVSFLPTRVMLGTDTMARSAARVIECPFTGAPLAAIPALYPDVAVIHVHEADRFGNARIRGITVADPDLARAAKRLIITCERLVSDAEIRREPDRTTIPFYCVDAVCEVPFGSYPANMPYAYYSDEDHLRGWLRAEEDPVTYAVWVDRYILSVRSFDEYLGRCGGRERLETLRRLEFLEPLEGSRT